MSDVPLSKRLWWRVRQALPKWAQAAIYERQQSARNKRLLAFNAQDADDDSRFGTYVGRVAAVWLEDGRLMELLENFGFLDGDRVEWFVPAGAKVDGASIPRPLWSLVGSPFTGKYRDASVIHDWYCDKRTRPWKEVHRVFYNGMRASGISEQVAKTMFAAVYAAGPRWSDTVVQNAQVVFEYPEGWFDGVRQHHSAFSKAVDPTLRMGGAFPFLAINLRSIDAIIEKRDLSVTDIEHELDVLLFENPDLEHIYEDLNPFGKTSERVGNVQWKHEIGSIVPDGYATAKRGDYSLP